MTAIEAGFTQLWWDYRVAQRTASKEDYRFAVDLPSRLNGISFVGNAARLRLVLERVRSGEAIRVGSLGGSITHGQGAGGPEVTYAAQFVMWLNAAMPPNRYRGIGSIVPGSNGTGWAPGAAGAGTEGRAGSKVRRRALQGAGQQGVLGEGEQAEAVGPDSTAGIALGALEAALRVEDERRLRRSGTQRRSLSRRHHRRRRRGRALQGSSASAVEGTSAAGGVPGGPGPSSTRLSRNGAGEPVPGGRRDEGLLAPLGRDSSGSGAQQDASAVRRSLPEEEGAGDDGDAHNGDGGEGSEVDAALVPTAPDVPPVPSAPPPAPPRHAYYSGAVPGTQSAYMSSCVHHHLPPDVDLVMVEYAMNDSPAPSPHLGDPDRRGFERLLRKVLRLPSRPAVLLVHMYTPAAAHGRYFHTAERDFSEYAQYYGLPSVSLRAAVMPFAAEAVAAQAAVLAALPAAVRPASASAPSASVADLSALAAALDALPPSVATLTPAALFNGGKHHPGRGGHVVAAELLITLALDLLASNERLAANPAALLPAAASTPRLAFPLAASPTAAPAFVAALAALSARPLPPPVSEGNHEAGSATCYIEHLLTSIVVPPVAGWNWTDEGRSKWGWVALEAGRTLRLKLSTQTPGERRPKAEKAPIVLQVAYLQSYQHMGTARLACEGGCACEAATVDAFSASRRVSVTAIRDVQVTQAPECVLSLTTLGPGSHKGASAEDVPGSKFKLLGVVVGEEPGAREGGVSWVRPESHIMAQVFLNMTLGLRPAQ